MENNFHAVKIFSATMSRERQTMGERITEWMASQPALKVIDKQVLQSSDCEYHCLSVVLFLRYLHRP